MSDLYERLLSAVEVANRTEDGYLNAVAVEAVLKVHVVHDGRCTECVEWCDCLDGVETSDVIDAGLAAQQCPHGNVPEPCGTVRAIARALDVPIGEIN